MPAASEADARSRAIKRDEGEERENVKEALPRGMGTGGRCCTAPALSAANRRREGTIAVRSAFLALQGTDTCRAGGERYHVQELCTDETTVEGESAQEQAE